MNETRRNIAGLFTLACVLGACDGAIPDTGDSAPATVEFPVQAIELLSDVLDQTEGITFNDQGRLFVSTLTQIHEVFPDGSVQLFSDAATAPIGLAPGPGGAIYACDFGALSFSTGASSEENTDGSVLLLESDGSATVVATGLADPNFVAVRPDGDLLVSDDFTTRISLVPAAGGEPSVWTSQVDCPNGMAFSPDAAQLYVAQTFQEAGSYMGDSRVWTIPVDAAGNAGEVELLATLEDGSVNDGVAVDEHGYLYVAANLLGKIFRVDPRDGSFITVAEGIQYVASLAFGQGEFNHNSIYATQLFGGTLWEIPVGVAGAPLYQ